ncbi:MAG: hypothetical protein ACKOSS_02855 [Planctomycetia bacterium]
MRLRALALLALSGVLACATVPAEPALETGESAPEFEGAEFVNTEPCSFKSLRGHAVLVEVFRTW